MTKPRLRLYALYADLLEYPAFPIKPQMVECRELLQQENPAAGELLAGFVEWVNQEALSQLEELYTHTFDLQAVCCPYVGHHLFGDNYQRSWFMAHLNHGYQEKGFSCGSELPDHVAVVLRFLARGDTDEFSQVLLQEGLIPAVEKMTQAFDHDGQHPYGRVLRSLITLLQDGQVTEEVGLVSTQMGGLRNA